MQLAKARLPTGEVRLGILQGAQMRLAPGAASSLSEILHADRPAAKLADLWREATPALDASLLAPLDAQEVWAAGVTYQRSQEARERESVGAARFYDLVYTAARPELFFKATPHRVAGPGAPVRVRADSRWSVPEPEFALVLSPQLRLV